jgi:molybdopterin converting factor small subunit
MRVVVPSPIASYTGRRREVEAEGATLAELLADLERRHPGIRFRIVDEQGAIRPHIKMFVNREQATTLEALLPPGAEVLIVAALSGG